MRERQRKRGRETERHRERVVKGKERDNKR